MVRIAINGFGRIGRLVLRAAIDDPNIEIAAINDLSDPYTLAHLLKYDSVHGRFAHQVFAFEDRIKVANQDILVCAEKDPKNLPWKKLGVDVVVESTGIFRTKETMQFHIDAGAKKVLLSAPLKGDDPEVKTLVLGVNEHEYNGEAFVTNASCTTNCFAPMAKVINDNFGIASGVMTTVHAYTADQRLQDAPHSDLRRAKAAALNIIPTSTGAAKAVMKVIPQLKGRLVASAIRVPTPDGSLVSFVCELKQKDITPDKVNDLFRNVANYHLKGIVEYSEDPLVSSDIVGNAHSCIFDSTLTTIVEDDLLSVTGWYDNEWGYSNRMVDVIKYISK